MNTLIDVSAMRLRVPPPPAQTHQVLSRRTKIVNHSPFSINEVNVCRAISTIPYHSAFFSILRECEPLDILSLDDTITEKLKLDEHMKYYLFTYADKHSVDLMDVLYSATSVKKLISDIIHAFQHVLYALHLLNDHGVCYFHISPLNILFLDKYREKPVLSDFKFSLQLKKLNYTYISRIIHNIDQFTYLPFEVHILYYFVKHHMVTISHGFIEEFCENFVDNLAILELFSDAYKTRFKEQCIETMRPYINHSRTQIIQDILERHNKWDVYGISVIFIQLFGCITKVFSLKSTCISQITMALTANLHPDAQKRLSLEETLNVCNKWLNEEPWSFADHLDNAKLPTLLSAFTR